MGVKFIFVFIIGLFFIRGIKAQEERTEICIDFRAGSYAVDLSYMDNATRLDELANLFQQLKNDTALSIVQLKVSGAFSLEGGYWGNRRLATKRMLAVENYVRSHVVLPDSLVIRHDNHYILWQKMMAEIESSNIDRKGDVLDILREFSVHDDDESTVENCVLALRKLDNGKVWRALTDFCFPKMRNACVVLVTLKKQDSSVPEPKPAVGIPVVEPVVETPEPEPVEMPVAEPVVEMPVAVLDPEEQARYIYLKTNAVGWGMLVSNIAVEIDLAKHWSFTLPVYYSALNYFTSNVKFRTTCLQPELRYWVLEENTGWFGGVHFGLAWYNYAKGGDWRYQDHNRNAPLYGGGLSAGYRMPVSKNNRWWMEFSLGGGVYKLHYDVFHNDSNGQLVDTRKRTFFGIDQVSVSFAYRFDLEKGGQK